MTERAHIYVHYFLSYDFLQCKKQYPSTAEDVYVLWQKIRKMCDLVKNMQNIYDAICNLHIFPVSSNDFLDIPHSIFRCIFFGAPLKWGEASVLHHHCKRLSIRSNYSQAAQ